MIIHCKDIRRKNGPVHMLCQDGDNCICGSITKWKWFNGDKIQILYNVDEPITCKGCIKGIELVVRHQLRELNFESLERALNIIIQLRKEQNAN